MKTIISVLGADVYKDQSGFWHSCDLNMRNSESSEPSESFRMHATAYLAKRGVLIYAQGGLADDTHPPIGEVIEYELRELGIPKSLISIESHSKNTRSQLIQLQDFLRRKMPKTIIIVTNDWHIPRVKAMIEYLPEFKTLKSMDVVLEAAEAVLLKSDPEKWQPKIAKMRARPEMKAIIGLEKKGVHQLENGRYEPEQ